jgi:hypothetical protein
MPDPPVSDFYVVIHVWTTCDEHGVCVSKDSAEVIELAWILINARTLEEVPPPIMPPTTTQFPRISLAFVIPPC